MLRPLLVVPLAVAFLALPAPRAVAAPGCAPGGSPAPSGAAQRQVGDLDGDGLPDTEIDLNGTVASTGRSDTLTAASAQDPVVTSAQTISCGDLTINQDGVQEP
ncbi:hypothetical protein [Mycobacterium asiaticum]|uniref:hypothetical protein n=1 Tax=Mycobacterium asiaticum TaxID=1790 RepID=UPI0007F03B88|nr:hypothetical protein [Mycobacterium asiaticum]OBI98181.1 hypothetical protein A5661_01450 [Mycobacterium asiaticum]